MSEPVASVSGMRNIRSARRRAALSEMVATMLTVAITIVTGFAVFSFANTQGAASATAYGTTVGTYVEQIEERFLIVNVAYNYPSANKITIWFYNYGSIDTKITNLYVGTSPSSLASISSSSLPLSVSKGAVVSIEIDYTVTSGTTYYVKALGAKGNTQLYFQSA